MTWFVKCPRNFTFLSNSNMKFFNTFFSIFNFFFTCCTFIFMIFHLIFISFIHLIHLCNVKNLRNCVTWSLGKDLFLALFSFFFSLKKNFLSIFFHDFLHFSLIFLKFSLEFLSFFQSLFIKLLIQVMIFSPVFSLFLYLSISISFLQKFFFWFFKIRPINSPQKETLRKNRNSNFNALLATRSANQRLHWSTRRTLADWVEIFKRISPRWWSLKLFGKNTKIIVCVECWEIEKN